MVAPVRKLFRQKKLFIQGGPGSGFKGHAGRPGLVGGSTREGSNPKSAGVSEEDLAEMKRVEDFLNAPVDHRKRVEEVAKRLGYPVERVESTKDEGYIFNVGGQPFRADGEFDPKTGKITVYDVDEKSESTLEGILAHEIQHSRWQKYKDSYQGQFVEIQRSIRDEPDPKNWLIKADGSLRNPALKDKFWAWEIHEEFLSGSKWELLQKEDGVTAYSISYWNAVNPISLLDKDRAVDETLAEIARLEQNVPLSKMESVPPVWKDLYKRVRKHGS